MKKTLLISLILSIMTLSGYSQDSTYLANIEYGLDYLNVIRTQAHTWRNVPSVDNQFKYELNYHTSRDKTLTKAEIAEYDTLLFGKDNPNAFTYILNPKLCKEAEKRARYMNKKYKGIHHMFNTTDMDESLYMYESSMLISDKDLVHKSIMELIIDGPRCVGHRIHLLGTDKPDYINIGIGYFKITFSNGNSTFVMVILTANGKGLNNKDNFNNKLKNGTYLKNSLVN